MGDREVYLWFEAVGVCLSGEMEKGDRASCGFFDEWLYTLWVYLEAPAALNEFLRKMSGGR